jgi:ssDNA-binding replication factor A large subunit
MTLTDNEVRSIAELRPKMSSINVRFKVLNKGPRNELFSRRDQSVHFVSNTKVGDDTAVVSMPLWDDAIDHLEEGKTYVLTNGYTGLYRGSLRLKIGRNSEIKETEKEIDEVNQYHDKSEITLGYRQQQRHYFQGY